MPAIWEEHLGWFRYESSTEFYNVPPSAVAKDMVELAGKAPVLQRARRYLGTNDPLHALHLTEAVLMSSPYDVEGLRLKLEATELLMKQSGRENFSEVRWLESDIQSISSALDEAEE